MITSDLSKGIFFADDHESVPPESNWGSGQFTKMYIEFTGGNQDFNNPDARAGIYLSNAYARLGTKSYKLQLQKRTDMYGTCCQWVRSETAWMANGDLVPANEWRFASISTLIDPAVDLTATIKYQIAYDHKESPDNLQTPFWLGIQGPNYIVAGRHVGAVVPITTGGPVVKGKWEDWILERTWTNPGYIKLYRNKVLVYSKTGDMRTNGAPFARLQHGIYKWAWQNANNQGEGPYNPPADDKPIIMYIDQTKMGSPSAKLEDFYVDGGGGTPVPPDPQPTPDTVHIVSGKGAEDKYFNGGTPFASGNFTERFGNFVYNIPVKAGKHTVKLTLNEIFFATAGSRLMNVYITGKNATGQDVLNKVLSSYDIFAETKEKYKTVVKSFETEVAGTTLQIKFETVKDQAKSYIIDVTPSTTPTPPVDTKTRIKSATVKSATVTIGTGDNTAQKVVPAVEITWADNSISLITDKSQVVITK